jgi:hypothetical protein
MKKQESKIIYLFVILIVIIGIASFIFRAELASTFLSYDSSITQTPAVVNKKDELNLDLLRNEKIKALKTNFSIFDYDDLNKTQDALEKNFRENAGSMEQVITNEDGSQSIVKPVFFRVDVGNNNPFADNKAIK